jgi:metal-responsive CopG/Arc/MetJ family transcriptional regulator
MGKKRKYTEQVGVMFEPKILKQLNEITDELDMSNSEFIRTIVEEELNRKQLIKQEN